MMQSIFQCNEIPSLLVCESLNNSSNSVYVFLLPTWRLTLLSQLNHWLLMIQLIFYAQPIPQETFIYTVKILFSWALAVNCSSTLF